MGRPAFQNVKDQIGYCGIWCDSCAAGNGVLTELSKRYAEIVEKYELKKGLLEISTSESLQKVSPRYRSCPYAPDA